MILGGWLISVLICYILECKFNYTNHMAYWGIGWGTGMFTTIFTLWVRMADVRKEAEDDSVTDEEWYQRYYTIKKRQDDKRIENFWKVKQGEL